jgi:sugar phosphate isomerase/epimerase
METKNELTRRKFIGSASAVAAFAFLPAGIAHSSQESNSRGTVNSEFGGVKIGAITYSWRNLPGGLENIIKYSKDAGINHLELMSGDLEAFLGAPKNPAQAMNGSGQRPQRTPEQEALITKYNDDLKNWRINLNMDKVAEAKKLFDDAGIKVHIVKFSPGRWSEPEIDYTFKVARAVGAKGVTEEIGEDAVKKMAPSAEKYGMYAIFHNHMQFATQGFSIDPFLSSSKAVMLNFDAGHFFGSTGIHPNTIIEKYHERIISIHLKDKTGPKTNPANMNQVWGQGECPIEDILLLLKKTKWPIHVDIELEYEVKPWSDAVKETKKCVGYARQILI